MFKRAITFKNIDGKTVTEDFYFNLTKVELTKQILKNADGPVTEDNADSVLRDWADRFRKIGESGDASLIIETFEKMVMDAVGKRTDDGLFLKTKEYAQAFVSSHAYSNLIDELVTNTKFATEFTNALFPEEMFAAVQEARDARARSEAQMQGHQTKQEAPKAVETVNLPVAPTPTIEVQEAVRKEAADMAAFQEWQRQQQAVQQ